MFSRPLDKNEVRGYEDKIEDLKYELKVAHQNADRRLADSRFEKNEELDALGREIGKLEGELVDTRTLLTRASNVVAREAKLKEGEALLAIKNDAFGDIKIAVRLAQEEGEAVAESRYKEGYADGISDGIRKGLDHSVEERAAFRQLATTVIEREPAAPAQAPTPVIVTGHSHDAQAK